MPSMDSAFASPAITVITQLINDARSRWGASSVVAVEVKEQLFDEGLEAVTAAGGPVGFDHFVVDGATVRLLPPASGDTPRAFVVGEEQPHQLG